MFNRRDKLYNINEWNMSNKINIDSKIKLQISIQKYQHQEVGNIITIYPIDMVDPGYYIFGHIPIVVDENYLPISTKYAFELNPFPSCMDISDGLRFLNVSNTEFEAMDDDDFLLEAGFIL